MAVTDQTPVNTHTGNGVSTVFAYSFLVLLAADLSAKVDGVPKTQGVDFTVSGAGTPGGGSVTFTTAPSSGAAVTLFRDTALERATDYQNNGDLLAATVNRDFDRIWLAMQEQGRDIGAVVRAPVGEALAEMPDAATRANRLLAFDGTGAPEESPFTTTQVASTIAAAYTGMGTADAAAFIAAGTGATTTTVQEVLRRYVDARGYATLADAEARAYALGVALWMSPGNYTVNGAFTCRVPIWGWGATLTQINTTKTTTNASTLQMDSLTDASVVGLKIAGGGTWGGFFANACTNLKLIDVSTAACVGHGFYADLCNGVEYARCRSDGVVYNHAGTSGVPVAGGSADGFYNGGSTDVTYEACVADGFYRIGFVSEGSGATKSERVKFVGCRALNGSNCDSSTTEYNTGFWTENTNGTDFEHCTVRNIAGNTGQTSGRVRGMRVASTGASAQALNNVTRCKVFGGAGRVPVGIDISTGAGTFLSVTLRDCLVSNADRAVEVAGGYKSVDIRSVDVDDCSYGVLVNAGGGTIEILNIDDLAATNCTFTPDTGIVHIFSAIAGCEYTLSNIRGGWPHVMRGAIPKITVRDCSIAWGSNTYSTFIGADIRINSSLLTWNASAANSRLYSASASGVGSRVTMRNCKLTASSFALINPDGTDCSLYVSDSEISAVGWLSSTVGTFVHSFSNIDWTGVSATFGAYKKDGTPVAATRHELIVRNCRFVSANVADTPLLKGTSGTSGKDNPTFSILQANTYNTTALYNFAAGVTNTNNIQTL